MKITWPPPQVIFVGLESNQQGQAASQEHASSSWPETFQGVFFSSARETAVESATRRARKDSRLENFKAYLPYDIGKTTLPESPSGTPLANGCRRLVRFSQTASASVPVCPDRS